MRAIGGTRRLALEAAGITTVAAFVGASAVERAVVRAVGPTPGELLWISDVVLAVALGLVTYLWLNLRLTRAELTELEREQLVVRTELAMAADIQRRLLPEPPEATNGLHVAARLELAREIGGDFYDFIALERDALLVFVGDVAGKGVPAALQVNASRTLLRVLAREAPGPAELLARLNAALYDTSGGSVLTGLLLLIDPQRRCVTFANAGHVPGLLLDHGKRQVLTAGGPPLGLWPDTTYPSFTLPLPASTLGVIVTDGITEALAGATDSALDRIETARNALTRSSPEAVCEAVMRLADGAPPPVDGWHDDRTVVVFSLD